MGTMDRILVIDDDVELCSLVGDIWSPRGSASNSCMTENVAWSGRQREHPLVVLDVMLPGMNGLEVLRRIRNTSRVPVLLLTARGEDVDRIIGLEVGADDYLPKPFNPGSSLPASAPCCGERKVGKSRGGWRPRSPARGRYRARSRHPDCAPAREARGTDFG